MKTTPQKVAFLNEEILVKTIKISIDNLAKTFASCDHDQQAEFFNIVGETFSKFGSMGGDYQISCMVNGMVDYETNLNKHGISFIKKLSEYLK